MYALCSGTNNRVGEREHEIVEELKPHPNERVFNKITPSAFTSTPIELVLRTYGVDTSLRGRLDQHVRREHVARRLRPGLRLLPRRGRVRRRLAGDSTTTRPGGAAPLRRDRRPRGRHRADRGARSRLLAPREARRGRRRRTFTDIMLWDDGSGRAVVHKLRVDPEDPANAMTEGLRELCDVARLGRRPTSTRCCTGRRWRRTPCSSARARGRNDHDRGFPGHHLHRSPSAAPDVLDLPGPPVARAGARLAREPPHVRERVVAPDGDVSSRSTRTPCARRPGG